jgi:hypothetical protein
MLSICLSVCLSVYLAIYLSLYLSICLSVCLSIYLSICLSIYLSIYLSVCLSVCLSIYISIYPSIYLFIYLSVCLSVCLSIYLYIHLSICQRRVAGWTVGNDLESSYMEKGSRAPNSSYHPRICLDSLRRAMNTSARISGLTSVPRSLPGTSECEEGVLPTDIARSAAGALRRCDWGLL